MLIGCHEHDPTLTLEEVWRHSKITQKRRVGTTWRSELCLVKVRSELTRGRLLESSWNSCSGHLGFEDRILSNSSKGTVAMWKGTICTLWDSVCCLINDVVLRNRPLLGKNVITVQDGDLINQVLVDHIRIGQNALPSHIRNETWTHRIHVLVCWCDMIHTSRFLLLILLHQPVGVGVLVGGVPEIWVISRHRMTMALLGRDRLIIIQDRIDLRLDTLAKARYNLAVLKPILDDGDLDGDR